MNDLTTPPQQPEVHHTAHDEGLTGQVNSSVSAQQRLRVAAGLIALGASTMIVKGLARIATGGDPSLVPWFGLGVTLGLTLACLAVIKGFGHSWPLKLGAGVGAVGVAASAVAIGFLITGTIPETSGSPAAVDASYGLLSAASILGLTILAATIARRRLLPGRWRWVLLGVLAAQLPIFALAEAIGEAIGRGSVTDGLGLTLTGAAWVLVAYSLTRGPVQRVGPPFEG